MIDLNKINIDETDLSQAIYAKECVIMRLQKQLKALIDAYNELEAKMKQDGNADHTAE